MSASRPDGVPSQHPCPPGRRSRWHPLLKPTGVARAVGRFTSSMVSGFYLHFVADRQVKLFNLCIHPEPCALCRLGYVQHWYGYAAAIADGSGRAVLVAIPRAAWQCSPDVQAQDGRLAGWWFTLRRLVNSPCGPLQLRLEPPRKFDPPVPQPFDVVEEVAQRYGQWRNVSAAEPSGGQHP
jgi:hypothetical protein